MEKDIIERLYDVTDRDRISDAQEEILALRNKVGDQQAEIEGMRVIIKDLERRLDHAEWLVDKYTFVDKYREEKDTK